MAQDTSSARNSKPAAPQVAAQNATCAAPSTERPPSPPARILSDRQLRRRALRNSHSSANRVIDELCRAAASVKNLHGVATSRRPSFDAPDPEVDLEVLEALFAITEAIDSANAIRLSVETVEGEIRTGGGK